MRHTRLLAFLGIVFFTFSCKNKTERITESAYDNNQPKRVCEYLVDGDSKTLIGETAYYPSGKKMMEGKYRNEKKNGTWTTWHDNGKKWSEGDFIEGIRHGHCITWYLSGQKRYEGNYRDGKKTGVWKFWDENGKLINTTDFNKPD